MVNIIPLATISAFATLLGTAFALGRLYFRWIHLRVLRWDDVFLFAATAVSIGGYVVIAWMTYTSFLHTRNEIKYRTVKKNPYYWKFLAQNEAAMAVYTIQHTLSRLSLIFSYRSFCPYTKYRTQRRAVNIVGILTVIVGALFTYGTLFPCSPPKLMRYPNTWINNDTAYCLGPREIFWWSFGFNALCDLAVLLLPFWLLKKYADELQERYQRNGLLTLYCLGTLCFLLGVMRIHVVWALHIHAGSRGDIQIVSLYRQMGVWILTIVQANLYLVIASIPTMRRAFSRLRLVDPYAADTEFSEHLPNIDDSTTNHNNNGGDFDDESFRQMGRAEMQQRHMHLKPTASSTSGSQNGYSSYRSQDSRNTSTVHSLSGFSGGSTPEYYDVYDRGKCESPDGKDLAKDYFKTEHRQKHRQRVLMSIPGTQVGRVV